MPVKNSANYPADRPATRSSLINPDLRHVIGWLLTALILIALLWSVVLSKLENDKQVLEENALKQAISISKAYAQYLTRTVEQLDQLTKQIQYGWEKSNGYLTFEQMTKSGLLSIPQFSSVAVYDEQGRPVTTTIPVKKIFTVTDREYFKFHKENSINIVRIGKPTIGRLSGKKVIQITRRLEKPNGDFAGVLVMGVAPEFFSLFLDDPMLGHGGILAFIGEDGVERMSKLSSEQVDTPALLAMPVGTGNEGNGLAPGAQLFSDGKVRFTATEKLNNYPFYALVGLSREDVLLPFERDSALYRKIAIAVSVVVVLFSLFAMLMTIRLRWRRHQAEAIRETYRLATEGGNEGFYILIPIRNKSDFIIDFQIVDCNEKGAAFFGMEKNQFFGTKISTFYSGENFECTMATYRNAMQSGFYEDDYRLPADSPIDAEWLKRKFVRSENGLAVTLRDISEPKRHEREMSRLATEDGITGLPNRHWLMTYLPQALIAAQANSTKLAILFIDLDDFKNVNDSLGHSAGDELLREVATRLRSVVRSTDKVVRIGGDEFTVVLEAIHNEENVANIALTINRALHQPFDIPRDTTPHKSRIGASIGISLFPRDGQDVETLLKNADIAMYAAKTGSKGRFRFYDRLLYDNIKLRLDTEQELLHAIRDDQFVIHYQPRVDTQSGKLVGMEALVRWLHPERGLIPPGDFITLAEETGMINAIGEIVLDKVCEQIAAWIAQDVDAVPVSVNVSAHQFNEGKVGNLISANLDKHMIPAALLEIELTESAMMHNSGNIFDQIAAINAMSIKIHVDDFGTGYSSLSLLQRLDMDVLKIDRAFTSQLGIGKDGEIFFTAIVSMAKALGMRVVAEGVETIEQLTILQTLSCDEIQGYYVARPMPAADIAAIFSRKTLFNCPA